MCGIVGVIQYESAVDRALRQKVLKILFSETMMQTESRGKDATGVYQVHKNGDWLMTKKGVRVTDWIPAMRSDSGNEDPIDFEDIVGSWLEHPKDLAAVVGHCRAATVGSRGKDNNDNHPFAVQLDEDNAILGIHNGTLTNHEIIFDRLPDLLPRHGKVDSESLFHFLYHLTNGGTEPIDGDMLKYMGERVEGAYAVITMNTRFPEQVVTFRKDRPMEFFMVAPLNCLVITSEKKFFEAALEKYNFIRQMLPEYKELPALRSCHRGLMDREFRIFDTSLPWPEGHHPTHGDFDKISDGKGDMTKISSPIIDDWKSPGKTSKITPSNTRKITPASNTSVKTTKANPVVTSATNARQASEQVDTVIVEAIIKVPIGMDDAAAKGIEHVKGLGLLVQYDTMNELAKSIGIKEKELEQLSGLELANKLASIHFSIGHAAARLSAQKEVSDIRSKASDNTKLLGRVAEKQRKAEIHIWEHRQLVTILLALAQGNFKLDASNVKISLAAFPQLADEKKQSILKSAKNILECQETKLLIKKLLQRFNDVAQANAKKIQESKGTP